MTVSKTRDLCIALALMAAWFFVALILIKLMNRKQNSSNVQQREEVKEDTCWLDLEPPSYEEVMQLDNRLETV